VVATAFPTWGAASKTSVPLPFQIVSVIVIESVLVLGALLLAALITVAIAYLSKDKAMYTDHTLSADEKGVTEETAYNTSMYRWPAITGIAKTRSHLFVLVGPGKAHVVPRRSVDTGEWEAFALALAAMYQQSRA